MVIAYGKVMTQLTNWLSICQSADEDEINRCISLGIR